MKFYIYRNFTVENLFIGHDAEFSGYSDIAQVPEGATNYVWFYLPSINLNTFELANEVFDFKSRLDYLLTRIPTNKRFLLFTLDCLFEFKGESSSTMVDAAIQDYNAHLYDLSSKHQNVKVIDFRCFIVSAGQGVFDWRFYYISQSLINPKLNATFALWFQKQLDAIDGKRKKCLVLDLDNTLWGGILGEDGLEGIQLGNTYPGRAYYDFQIGLMQAKDSGVILTLCSKNNESDVLEYWEKHPAQVLKQNHVAAYRINWQDKATNIRELAEELNIGLDSMVFIDDNPAERERVKQELPMVSVPDFPKQPYLLPQFLKEVYQEYFQIYQLTAEDKKKTDQYIANAERKVFSQAFKNADEYLASLSMELKVFNGDEYSIPRIAQMTQKTNQFNLTTPRLTEQDIWNYVLAGAMVNCLGVKDRFGDNGITVASIISIHDKVASIDAFLLSCRILGRDIEKAYLFYLINELQNRGIEIVKASYIPTVKNKQTERFYESCGFNCIQDENGTKRYQMGVKSKIEIKPYYKFEI
jgi:FkbH-like protein